jgi:hypothetical protein
MSTKENDGDILFDEDVCPICYEPNLDYETKCCKNKFHKECLDLWRKRSFTCPLCRTCSTNEFKAKYNKVDYNFKIFNSHISLNLNNSVYPSFIFPYTKIKRVEIKKKKLIIMINVNNLFKELKIHIYKDLFPCFELVKKSILDEYAIISNYN